MKKSRKREIIKSITQILMLYGNELAKDLVPEVVKYVANCNLWGGKYHTEKVRESGEWGEKSGQHLIRMFNQVMDEKLLLVAAKRAGIWLELPVKAHFQKSMHQYFDDEVQEFAKVYFLYVVHLQEDEDEYDDEEMAEE